MISANGFLVKTFLLSLYSSFDFRMIKVGSSQVNLSNDLWNSISGSSTGTRLGRIEPNWISQKEWNHVVEEWSFNFIEIYK